MEDLGLLGEGVVGWGGEEVDLGFGVGLVSGEEVVRGEGLLYDVVVVFEHLVKVVLGVV